MAALKRWHGVCGCVVALCLVTAAQAAPLNLHEDFPLVMGSFLDVNYDPAGAGANGLLTVQGNSWFGASMMINTDGVFGNEASIDPGDFSLNITINPATGEMVSGVVKVTGDADYSGISETLYYSEQATVMGYSGDSGGNVLEFRFIQQAPPPGDPEVALILPEGSLVGVYVSFFDPAFDPTAAQPFSVGFSDISMGAFAKAFPDPTPEPATIGVLVLGAFAVLRRRAAAKK